MLIKRKIKVVINIERLLLNNCEYVTRESYLDFKNS